MLTNITFEDRKNIEKHLRRGESPQVFSQKIGRAVSSIRYEMRRNTLPGKSYSAEVAQKLAIDRARNAGIGRLSITPAIAKQIRKILAAKIANPGEIFRNLLESSKGRMQTSPSSIRRYIYQHPELMERIPPRRVNLREESQETISSPKYVDGNIVTY
ncbi:transposase [Perkinsela sp. CCAP 1560/4]|nr:transposase [Perkinsela sp. CCAP 1560/4]|eukprot:KNH05369.1 transposase [Perkinsela sp. CCAP 1560/4]